MKKLSILLFLIPVCNCIMAQYCGHIGNPSGSGQCTATGLPYKGFTKADSLPPLINGTESTTVIQFQNFDTIWFGGQFLLVLSFRIDSLGNLPDGLCWTTNKANNTFTSHEAGCIKINGAACDAPGQYKLIIFFTLVLSAPISGMDPPIIHYNLRLKNVFDQDTPVDTTQQTNNSFIPYGQAPLCVDWETVNSIEGIKQSLSITPNPLTDHATVQFFSNTTGRFTQSLTNVIGSEVYRNDVEVTQGENRLAIDASNLPAGVYFYALNNGTDKTTKKIIVD